MIGVKKFLEPLDKFEIVLEATFYQTLDGNYLNARCSW